MKQYDVIVIGAGVIGSAVARELSRYELQIAVLERNPDVCLEQSGRNSAVIHGGFAYDEGSLKAECCVEGCLGFEELARELDIPYRRTGKLLVGFTQEDYESLRETMRTGLANGCRGLRMIDRSEIDAICPTALGEFALFSEHSGITDPFLYTVALAENACANGVEFFFEQDVRRIRHAPDGTYEIQTQTGELRTRWIVNAAGPSCGEISSMVGIQDYQYAGAGKGNYIILDKRMGTLLPMPVYPVPSNDYMGVHVTPTIDGNVIVGPDSEDAEDTADYGVSAQRMQLLVQEASRIWPHIHRKDWIRNYAGSNARWDGASGRLYDFVIEIRDGVAPRMINLINMQSPALTCALPIARRAAKLFLEREQPREKAAFCPVRKGIPRLRDMMPQEQERWIEEHPDYGEIICRCEQISRGELLAAIHNPLGVHSVSGIKYRSRASMGRCQGGYCQMRIANMLMEELGLSPEQVRLHREGSVLFTGRVRGE